MNQQVAFPGGVIVEVSAADGAGVRLLPRVDPDVSPHVVLTVEGFAALAAAERFLSRVDPHVHLQRPGRPKTLAADAADSRLDVCFEMSYKVLLGLKAFPTDAADVPGMSPRVVDQSADGVEGLPTHLAPDPAFFLLGRTRFPRRLETGALPVPAILAVVPLGALTHLPLVSAVAASGGRVVVNRCARSRSFLFDAALRIRCDEDEPEGVVRLGLLCRREHGMKMNPADSFDERTQRRWGGLFHAPPPPSDVSGQGMSDVLDVCGSTYNGNRDPWI